jgi:hypothetical protein
LNKYSARCSARTLRQLAKAWLAVSIAWLASSTVALATRPTTSDGLAGLIDSIVFSVALAADNQRISLAKLRLDVGQRLSHRGSVLGLAEVSEWFVTEFGKRHRSSPEANASTDCSMQSAEQHYNTALRRCAIDMTPTGRVQ